MVEPTETETKETLDAFAEAIEEILAEAEDDPEIAKQAPYTTPVRRLDEVKATRKPVVRQPLLERRLQRAVLRCRSMQVQRPTDDGSACLRPALAPDESGIAMREPGLLRGQTRCHGHHAPCERGATPAAPASVRWRMAEDGAAAVLGILPAAPDAPGGCRSGDGRERWPAGRCRGLRARGPPASLAAAIAFAGIAVARRRGRGREDAGRSSCLGAESLSAARLVDGRARRAHAGPSAFDRRGFARARAARTPDGGSVRQRSGPSGETGVELVVGRTTRRQSRPIRSFTRTGAA